MAGEGELLFTLKMKDEASQAIKGLQSVIGQLGTAVGGDRGEVQGHVRSAARAHIRYVATSFAPGSE